MDKSRVGLYVGLATLTLPFLWRLVQRRKVHRPPSPMSFPFVGNLFSIPSGHEYLAFAELGAQLKSDIVFIEILGYKVLILNSIESASDILDKRSGSHSDRPCIPMITDPSLMNWSGNISMIGYNDVWRHSRRILNNWLNTRSVTQFNDLQERQAQSLLQRLLAATTHPHPFKHVKDEFFFIMGSSMLQLAYGYKPEDPQDHFFKEMQLAFHNVASAGMQTNFFVNIFPVLLHVPDWFPGTGWKRTGRQYGEQQVKAKSEPYEWMKAQVASGTNQPSLLAPLLQGHQLVSGLSPMERDKRLKEIGIVLFGAGVDTSATFLVSLIAAMVLNPHIQAKAQQELDEVVGQAVLPKVSDGERLPYIRNLIDEVLRMYPALPFGVPHACFRDDNYRGYDIEKGTTMAIGRDPRHYEDPEVFNPDRYVDPNVPRPPAFGWGRPKCPGIHFAETSIFITTALLLSVFTFSKRKDNSGKDIPAQIELEGNSFVFELKPFDFEFKPRSDAHRQLIGAIDQ